MSRRARRAVLALAGGTFLVLVILSWPFVTAVALSPAIAMKAKVADRDSQPGLPDGVISLDFSPDSKLLAVGSARAGQVTIWDCSKGKRLRRLPFHTDVLFYGGLAPHTPVKFVDDERICIGAGVLTEEWNVRLGNRVQILHGQWPTGDATVAPFTGIVANYSVARIAKDGQNCPRPIACLAVSADRRQLAVGTREDGISYKCSPEEYPNTLGIWDLLSGSMGPIKSGLTRSIYALAFSPDQSRLAISGDRFASVFDVKAGRMLWTRGITGMPTSVAYSPDGRSLSISTQCDAEGAHRDNAPVYVLNALDGAELFRIDQHKGSVSATLYSPSGRELITGGKDGAIRIWDARACRETCRAFNVKGEICALALSPDGVHLAAGILESSNEWVTVWKVASLIER